MTNPPERTKIQIQPNRYLGSYSSSLCCHYEFLFVWFGAFPSQNCLFLFLSILAGFLFFWLSLKKGEEVLWPAAKLHESTLMGYVFNVILPSSLINRTIQCLLQMQKRIPSTSINRDAVQCFGSINLYFVFVFEISDLLCTLQQNYQFLLLLLSMQLLSGFLDY